MQNFVFKMIAEMQTDDAIQGIYALKSGQLKETQNGKKYLSCEIMDCSGTIPAVMWDYEGNILKTSIGNAVKLQGTVSAFKDTLQLTLNSISACTDADSIDIKKLVPHAPVDPDYALCWISDIVESMEDDEYKKLCKAVLDRALKTFYYIPAAKSVHHAFIHGLLMHTLTMLNIAVFLAQFYPVNRDLMITGTVLHDVEKQSEFKTSALGMVTDYSTKGRLLGHLVMGAQLVADVAKELKISEEKSVLVQHMILSHHGEPEFGAAVKPMTIEAELLSMIDLLDSKMEQYRELLAGKEPGRMTEFQKYLGKQIYVHQ